MPQTITNIPRSLCRFCQFWSFGIIYHIHFLGNLALLALGGRPQPLKKPSQSQKGHFSEKMNALNDTKTAAMSKSAEGNGEYL